MSDWRIERLGRTHDRSGFDCGKPPLDDFLRSLVTQYEVFMATIHRAFGAGQAVS